MVVTVDTSCYHASLKGKEVEQAQPAQHGDGGMQSGERAHASSSRARASSGPRSSRTRASIRCARNRSGNHSSRARASS